MATKTAGLATAMTMTEAMLYKPGGDGADGGWAGPPIVDIGRPRPRGFWLIGLALIIGCLGRSVCHAGDAPITLENGQVLLALDPVFGTISRILDKASGIDMPTAPELAENFRLVLALSGTNTVIILGKDQKLSGVDRTSDGLVLRWDGPLKDATGTPQAIAVRMEVKADGNTLQFGLHLDNATTNKVREAWYPLIGGLTKFGAPGKPADGMAWISDLGWTMLDTSFVPFSGAYPGQASSSFCCIRSAVAKKSLYFAAHDTIARYKVYHYDKHEKDSVKDVFVYIQHFPFTPPGKTFDGSPVVLRVIDGDWPSAAAVYRAWFERTFGICKPADSWIRRESFFLFTMFELPEGTINYRFKDIPRWAKEAKDHGINSVQISGWQVGGHDNGYPDYTPDPRLGTWKELEDGIKACHKLGMKVYFFVNYQQVMIDSDWYKKELVKYREWQENGWVTWNTGWAMGTLWGRMGHNKCMVGADPAFPEYRKIIVDQFAQLAQIGADGVHVDKMFPVGIDFNPDLPMSPDTGPWEGAITLTKEVFTACRKYNPGWAMSFECSWDRMMQFTCSTWWGGVFQVFPDSVGMAAIVSPCDYLGVNHLVCSKTTVMLAPRNFSGGLGLKPWAGLADYIKEIKRIDDKLADTVWLGDKLSDGLFRNRTTGKHVRILANDRRVPMNETFAGFGTNHVGQVRIHAPFQKTRVASLPAEIEVPGERIVFVEEL